MSSYRGPQRIRRAVGGRASEHGEAKTQRCVCTVFDADPECRDFCVSRSVWFFSVKMTSSGSVLINQPSRQNKTSALAYVSVNHWFVHICTRGYIPYWHFYNTCQIEFTLHVYGLTFISGGGGVRLRTPSQWPLVSTRFLISNSRMFFPRDHSVSTLLLKRHRESFQLCFWRQKAVFSFYERASHLQLCFWRQNPAFLIRPRDICSRVCGD